MKKEIKIHHWVKVALLLLVYDVIAINMSYGLALWLRFEMQFSAIPDHYLMSWLSFSPFFTVITCGIFLILKLYRSVWRYASINELERVIVACMFSFIVQVIGTCLFFVRMPVSYYIFGGLLAFLTVAGIRFSYRLARLAYRRIKIENGPSQRRVMIIGAGEAGRMLIRELYSDDSRHEKICCIIDDNRNKTGRMLENIQIVGISNGITDAVMQYNIDRIILAIPSLSAKNRRRIINICKETQCELQILPGISQILRGDVKVSYLRDVSVEDLLGRDTISIDLAEIAGYIKGKKLLITGGGGSIGSELARQISIYEPKQLILLDVYENNVYDVQQELNNSYPELDLKVLVGSVQDQLRVQGIMKRYRPDIVFHAAAHKHVPLLEESPNEAVKNNVLGTYEVAQAAMNYGVKRFILISTDKAVNPTNIMGASKRLCEMIIQAFGEKGKTEFAAVRFGNVLGSNGSVVPLFQKQIMAGGPVTVTHPEVTRYFMTIPEAVSLVLQAGSYAENGEIFVLDMGKPMKVNELAKNMIKLSGYEPNQDIQIEYIGLRPGEKLYEELLLAEEGMKQTDNQLIYIGKPLKLVPDFLHRIEKLKGACSEESDQIKAAVGEMVTEYDYKLEG